MASYTEFYCDAASGSNLNSGSTTSGTATHTYASGDWVAATGVFSVASGDPASDGVAVDDFASVYADGSTVTGFVGRVTARDATTITVSLTAKSGTAPTDGTGNRTLKVGGAWKGPNGAEGFPLTFAQSTMTNASGHAPRVNLLAGTYSITAAVTLNTSTVVYQGYSVTPGDGGRATIDGGTSGASYNLIVSNSGVVFIPILTDLVFQNNGASGSSAGVSLGANQTRCLITRCVFANLRGFGLSLGGRATVVECEAYGCNQSNTANTGGFGLGSDSLAVRCVSHDNSGSNSSGFVMNGVNGRMLYCVSESNGGHGVNMNAGSGMVVVTGCDIYSNGGSGVSVTPNTTACFTAENTNLVKNGAYGITVVPTGGNTHGFVTNCGFGSGSQANTSGAVNQTTGSSHLIETGSVTYASDVTPWADPDNGDFRVTLAAAKGAGRGTFTQTQGGYSGTVGYPDIGAAQHLETGGGGGLLPLVNNLVAG